ncbi:unnamed protein product [Haemonchus placei]|uniref:Astacin domain-containing protein n=1 Tax=Haemonchus placei TaxID=6290 RepID=A0A0N4WTP0_HAEPC|nr:unnamed protein product [Haemonchus placei]
MRFKLLALLLIAIVNGAISITDGPFSEKVSKISDMIKGKQNDVLSTLDVHAGKIASLLQELPEIKYDQVNPMGDSLNEVNERSNVEDRLFQSDILLTEKQAKTIISDIDEQVRGSNRTKRQAIADRDGVKLWKTGVNYYFSPSLSKAKSLELLEESFEAGMKEVHITDSKAKRAFLMGADMWQKYSCVNFKHNPYGKYQQPNLFVSKRFFHRSFMRMYSLTIDE